MSDDLPVANIMNFARPIACPQSSSLTPVSNVWCAIIRWSHQSTGRSSASRCCSAITARIASGCRPPSRAILAASSLFGNAGGESRACSSSARRSSWSRVSFQCCAMAATNLSPTPRPRLMTIDTWALENRISLASTACAPGCAVSLRTRRTTYSPTIRLRFSASMPPAVPESSFAPARVFRPGFLDSPVCPSYGCRLRVNPRSRGIRSKWSTVVDVVITRGQRHMALRGNARGAKDCRSRNGAASVIREVAVSSSPRDSSDVPVSPGLFGEGG
jgi:hypothetical protein